MEFGKAVEKIMAGWRIFVGGSGNAGFGHPTPPLFSDPVVSAGSIYKIPFDQKKCAFSTCLWLSLKKTGE